MAAHVSFVEVAKLLGAGASFMVLAAGLGAGLAHYHIEPRDCGGRLQGKNSVLIALAFAILVFAHAMTLWWLDLFHPALIVFYSAGGAIAFVTKRAKPATPGLRSR